VRRGLLCDYKVIVLSIDEVYVSRRIQTLLKSPDNDLKVDDAAKMIGCWKALAKQDWREVTGGAAMQRAVAFCQVIEKSKGAKTHKVSSKHIKEMFQAVVETYQAHEPTAAAVTLRCEVDHVDGTMGAAQKEEKLHWLKDEAPVNTCRILSNVRCLSEGVDVPALDAVLFLTPRNSQVDVVQSVGRVMRTAPGKQRGYVILPVVIPAGMEPHEALNDNKTYAVVWQVLQALRSHDDHFDALVNKLELIGHDPQKMEVIAITDKIGKKSARTKNKKGRSGRDDFTIGTQENQQPTAEDQGELTFEIGEIERAIYAKLVEKCGNRHHWEDWANDIATIARTHIERITAILANPINTAERTAFAEFTQQLRANVNDSLSDGEIIEMLAQHLVTEPVFAALFEQYQFAKLNPISKAMQAVLDALHEHHLEKETDTLQAFYDSVKMRAAGIDNAAGKQKIIVELYDKFFRNAFPKLTERLGIVYTPVEVVDFILHSVNHLLQTEFNQTLGSAGVHILDPFTGTGTFITRLLHSGLITSEQLPFKYQYEIHANEIVLLAYYIAAINIESTYHSLVGGHYQPFGGICLTDTFQLYEQGDLLSPLLTENNARRQKQKLLDIRVIIGNPPYSIGQKSENDNNDNLSYTSLDNRIRATYAARSNATLSKGLYDSYIRAIRWASDRLGDSGIIGFVTNAGWLEANTADGLRQCLAEEFSSIYIFHLRGNARTAGELRRKEKDNVFGSGSRAPIAISLLVKNPNAAQHGQIYWHDIGDYLSREEKLDKISTFVSIAGITESNGWQTIQPDAHGDWLNQRNDDFSNFIALGDKKSDAKKLFDNFSQGVLTSRDIWCYNASHNQVASNMMRMIAFYNQETAQFQNTFIGLDKKVLDTKVDGFINTDSSQISWSRALKQELSKGRQFSFAQTNLIASLYRPFSKQWLYYNRRFNEMVYQMPRIFPDATAENLVICISNIGAKSGFSTILSNALVDFQTQFNGQCFPLYLYDEPAQLNNDASLFATESTRTRRDAITDAGLTHFQSAYPNETINKEDLFYYIYGLLHSPDYRERYADNLSKELPRIPRVNTAEDFWAFSTAGRQLAALHLNYETVAPYPLTIETNRQLTAADYRVTKMKYGKRGKEKDLTSVIYNDYITLRDIPLAAYEYVVNGKPALDWVMERQCVKTDKDSGIVNDANDWANETMNNPRYPLELFMRVVTVSLETLAIVKGLPRLE
jgi:predicted helicase